MDAFIIKVVGDYGFQALRKASERTPLLKTIILSKTIVSWLQVALQKKYVGPIPGLTNSLIKCDKNFSGRIPDIGYEFTDSGLLHTAAAIGVALGVELPQLNPMIKNEVLHKVDQDIYLLVKANFGKP
jgi:hypothetical protein